LRGERVYVTVVARGSVTYIYAHEGVKSLEIPQQVTLEEKDPDFISVTFYFDWARVTKPPVQQRL